MLTLIVHKSETYATGPKHTLSINSQSHIDGYKINLVVKLCDLESYIRIGDQRCYKIKCLYVINSILIGKRAQQSLLELLLIE